MKKVTLSGRDIRLLIFISSKNGFEYNEANEFFELHKDTNDDSKIEMVLPIEAFEDILESIDNCISNADDYWLSWEDRQAIGNLFGRLKLVPEIV